MTTTPITDRLWSEMMDACKASGISPTQANKVFATLPQFRALEADVARLRALRELMGDVRDGSETTVTLSQDDASTNDFPAVASTDLFGFGARHNQKNNMSDINKTGEVINLQNDPNAQFSICWANANSRIGMLTWHEGELKFEGNADESAREFLRYLAQHAGLKLSLPNRQVNKQKLDL